MSHNPSTTLGASTSSSIPVLPTPPITPRKSKPHPPRLNVNDWSPQKEKGAMKPLGICPSEMIGKVLHRISRSPTHPTVTLHFADNTSFQIRVDGYDPMFPGIPKEIETDPALEPIFHELDSSRCYTDSSSTTSSDSGSGSRSSPTYTISHAKAITLSDRAFELGEKESEWKQNHSAIAFKFEEEGRWHCVWVTMAEYGDMGACVFRSFDDVYLDRLDRSPRKRRPGKGSGSWSRNGGRPFPT